MAGQKVRPEQLPSVLARSLDPVYLLAGAEPLLIQECRDQVFRAAQQQERKPVVLREARDQIDMLSDGQFFIRKQL